MTLRWNPTTPQAVAELRRLGLVTEDEARQLVNANSPKRGDRRGLAVYDGTRWVPCADDEAAITLSQRWLDEEAQCTPRR